MKNVLIYRIAPLFAVLAITACGYFEMPTPYKPEVPQNKPPEVPPNGNENKDPEYFGTWIRQGEDGITYEIEITQRFFIERTYKDGEPPTEIWRTPSKITTSENKFFKYEMTIGSLFETNFEFVDGGLKIGGGDVVYANEERQDDSFDGTWTWDAHEAFSVSLRFMSYQSSQAASEMMLEIICKPPYSGWLGTAGSCDLRYSDNRMFISLRNRELNRKLFKIENDKLIISNWFITNEDIKKYNDDNLSDTTNSDMFGLLFGFGLEKKGGITIFQFLQNYYAVEYDRK